MVRKIVLALLILGLVGSGAAAQDQEPESIFAFEDPLGDSFGPGTYTYPQDQSFPQELPDMLDLVEFRAMNGPNSTRYEFRFAQAPTLAQPWGGAGYNFHRLDLYVSWGGEGNKETFLPGAMVQFKEPWQFNLRVRDWQGAYLRRWDDNPDDDQAGIWQGEEAGFDVFVDGNAIIAVIPHSLLPPAEANWKFYVLVGLQDAYGPDHYRKITAEGGPWSGGGASETEYSPNVYDILATDIKAQKDQLDWAPGRLARLAPVGGNIVASLTRYLAIGAVVLVAAGAAALIWLFRKK